MLPEISRIKGIHPGIIIKRELIIRGIKNKELASSLDEHAQTISAILKGKRSVNPKLSIKLGHLFDVDSDYFGMLQACYDIKKKELENQKRTSPDLRNIRKSLFWDTDINNIFWDENRRFIIKRVFERGEEKEILEILEFYGIDIVKEELKKIGSSFYPSFECNVKKYIDVI